VAGPDFHAARARVASEAAERQTKARIERFVESLVVQEDVWDPAKHPRRGTPPNPGWFAPKGSGTTSLTGKSSRPPGNEAKSANQGEPPPEMLELAGAWWEMKGLLQHYKDQIASLPARIKNERAQLGSGGRYAYIHTQNLAKNERELETAQAMVPELEKQLRELEQKYHDAGYDDEPYGVWRADETWVGGVGIANVGRAVHSRGGSMIGPQSTGIEFDIALGAGSLRQLGKFALKKVLSKTPAQAAVKTRVSQVHSALDRIAQSQRTTAVLETSDGTRIVASGGRDLTPSQRALLGRGEVAARFPNTHAELTALEHALQSGLRPARITVSRPFCDDCIKAIEAAGGKITSPTTAEFPR
jgi:hypothetical protein